MHKMEARFRAMDTDAAASITARKKLFLPSFLEGHESELKKIESLPPKYRKTELFPRSFVDGK